MHPITCSSSSRASILAQIAWAVLPSFLKHIADCEIPSWAPFVPGGEAIDWAAVDLGLAWMEEHARCAGCENGGGPPDCTIRFTLERKDTIYAAPEGLCRRNGCGGDPELTISGANYMY
jgi:hypothetical protein